MTTTEAHHEIARSVKVLGDLDVSPKHKFLLQAHCEKILEHALAMRRCRDNLDRAREAKRVEVVPPVVVIPAPPPVPVVVVKVEKPKKRKPKKKKPAEVKHGMQCRLCMKGRGEMIVVEDGKLIRACKKCVVERAGAKS